LKLLLEYQFDEINRCVQKLLIATHLNIRARIVCYHKAYWTELAHGTAYRDFVLMVVNHNKALPVYNGILILNNGLSKLALLSLRILISFAL